MTHIEVLGLGCPRCATLAERVQAAADQMGLQYRFEKVTDLDRIIEVGVPVPALLVNGQVVASGIMPTADEIEQFLEDARTR